MTFLSFCGRYLTSASGPQLLEVIERTCSDSLRQNRTMQGRRRGRGWVDMDYYNYGVEGCV